MKHLHFIVVLCLLGLIPALAQQSYNPRELSGYLQKMAADKPAQAKARGALQTAEQTVCTLVRVNEGTTTKQVAGQYGCTVLDSIGGIYFVDIPISQLGPMSMDERVQRIEAHEMPCPAMHEVPEYVGAASAWSGEGLPQAFTGKIENKADNGWAYGIVVYKKLKQWNRTPLSFGIRTEINLVQKNFSSERIDFYEASYTHNYTQIPILANFCLGQKRFRGLINIGGFGGYCDAARRSFETGLVGGAGLEYRPYKNWALQIEARNYLGLSSVTKSVGPEKSRFTYRGSIGDPELISSSFYMSIPYHTFITDDGRIIEGKGVEPDIFIPLDRKRFKIDGRDNQLERALQHIDN